MRPLLLLVVLSSAPCIPLWAGDDAPQMTTVSAKTAKPGDTINISGVGLDEKKIDEVYLTDHKFDMKVKVLEQKETSITLRVPPFAKPGRMQLLVLTKGDDPKLLEQPVYLLIEDSTPEVSQVKKADPAKPGDQQQQKQ